MDTLTEPEQEAAELLSSVEALREPVTATQQRLSELKAKRADMETFTSVDSVQLARSMAEHDAEIAINETALAIDYNRLVAEMRKAGLIYNKLEKQTSHAHTNHETKYTDDGFLYEARHLEDMRKMKDEAARSTDEAE